jgi:ferric-dicitrate binding protein FerR (iron transport regulator)
MENAVDKHILFENFSGRSTPLRKKLIEEWLGVPGNIERYYEWLDEWEKANPQFVADEEAAYKRITGGGATVGPVGGTKVDPVGGETVGPVAGFEGSDSRKSNGRSRFFRFRTVAAAVIFLMMLGSAWALKNVLLYRSMSTAYGETRSVILPDGSLVSMNANSTIRYSRFGFGRSNREIFLAGEADFTVTRSAGSQPFVVTTEHDLNVIVLGTRFTVYARAKQARVVLRQGKVQLEYREAQKEKKLILQPGDLFTASAHVSARVEHIPNPENLSVWKDHEFLFDGTSLSEIAGMINDNFGLAIHFENQGLANHRITGSFHADTAVELLDVIAQLLNIHYNIREGTVFFFE